MDGDGTGLEQGSFVGPFRRAFRRESIPRALEQSVPDALWRLCCGEPRAVQRPHDPVAVDLLDGFGYGHDGYGRAMKVGPIGDAENEIGRDRGPSAVVHENDTIPRCVRRFGAPVAGATAPEPADAGRHGFLPPRAARDDGRDTVGQPRRGSVSRDTVGGGDHDDPFRGRDPREAVHRPCQHGPTGDDRVQLVGAAHPPAGTRRDDDDIERTHRLEGR